MEIKEVIEQLESLLHEAQYNGLSIFHDDGYACDYDSKTDSCKFNPHCADATDTKKET